MRLDKKSGPIMYTLTLPNDLNAKLAVFVLVSRQMWNRKVSDNYEINSYLR